jgi:hypothetical protein
MRSSQFLTSDFLVSCPLLAARDVTWLADPSEPGTICQLRCAGFTVHKADTALGMPDSPRLACVAAAAEDGKVGAACTDCHAKYRNGPRRP